MKTTMNKKGFLLGEETVKIVIAVVCIVFLIALLVLVYLSVSGDQQSKEAKNSMENVLIKEIKNVDVGGQVNSTGTFIPNPGGWFLFSFIEGDKKPNLCAGQNCICLCQNILINLFDRQIAACDKKGTCYTSSEFKKFDKIEIGKSGTFVLIQKINDFIYISKK
jgi:hypothetical protein